jgi:hypothetical protein
MIGPKVRRENKYTPLYVGLYVRLTRAPMSACAIALAIVAVMLLLWYTHADGFRSDADKKYIGGVIVARGQPTYSNARALGLDGAEYYQVRQLWHTGDRFTQANVSKVL